MTGSLTLTICADAAALCLWAAATGLRGRGPSRGLTASAVVLEGAVVLQLLLRAGGWAAGDRPAQPAVAAGYLAATALILPLAAGTGSGGAAPLAGGNEDGADAGAATAFPLAVGCAAVAVAALRLRATWG